MLKNKKYQIFFFFCLTLFLFQAGFVFALEIKYPTLPGGAQPPQDFLATASPEEWVALYIKYFFNFFIWVAGAIAFGAVVIGGITYLISAGKPENLASAKDRIVAAFFGLMVLLSSYIILNILNPQLLLLPSLQKPAVVPIGVEERADVTSPPGQMRLSTIETEIPFAAIIERIASTTKMEAIKENANEVLGLAGDLKDQNNDLKDETGDCSCSQAKPVCNGCHPGRPCNCDVCDDQRDYIEDLEKDDLDTIGKLKKEQAKSAEQARLLNEELARLEKARKLMIDCQLWPLQSLGESLNAVNLYEKNNWFILSIKYWDSISTLHLSTVAGVPTYLPDWAHFYCPFSGNLWGESTPSAPTPIPETPPSNSRPTTPEEPMACTKEVPVGEIIDRVLKLGNLMVQKLEDLIGLNEQIIDAVNEMHEAVSECSSQRCTSICIDTDHHCHKECVGSPCPDDKIEGAAEKIADLEKQIKDAVEKNSTSTDMGITKLADNVMSKILEDVQKTIRNPMGKCYSETDLSDPEDLPAVLLSNCSSAIGAKGPKEYGGNIRYCCYDEPEFNTCLNQCYTEGGQEKYKTCLQFCLQAQSDALKKAGETKKAEIIAGCRHKINFYCCGK